MASLLDHKECCKHVRRLGAEDYHVGHMIGWNLTEDLWIGVGRDMLQATTSQPEVMRSPEVEATPVVASTVPGLGVTATEVSELDSKLT
jgi:hypothetical protein